MISCGFLLEGTIMTRHLGLAVARPLSISAGHNSKAGWRKKTMRIWKGCDLLGSMIVRRGFTLTCSECGPKMQSLGKVEGKKKAKVAICIVCPTMPFRYHSLAHFWWQDVLCAGRLITGSCSSRCAHVKQHQNHAYSGCHTGRA